MFFWPRGRTGRTWTSLLALALAACGGDSGPVVPAEIEPVSGDGQAAVAGQLLPLPLVVRASDASGHAIPDLTVRFEVTQGGGSLEPAEVHTGSDGTASSVYTLGPTVGQPQQVVASIVGTELTTTFSATATNPAAVFEVADGNGQNAPAGTTVPVAPAVRALDAADQPVPGVPVRFAVTSGGGTIVGALKTTDAAGIATLDSWALGPTGINTLSASVDGQTVPGEPLTFVATTDASSGYNIKIRYLGTPSASQLLAFAQAEIRWESLVTGDLTDIPLTLPASDHPCGEGMPAITEDVDDLLILADLQPIDGPGAVLGRAGPCLTRLSNDLPVLGVMFFDTDDLDELETFELLDEVVVHEMGHVMGIGTLWPDHGLLADAVADGGTDPHFTGTQAIEAFDEAGGSSYTDSEKVPVETEGGEGTQDSHWRESVLGTELMTGFINVGPNPLSAITVRSLADEGYQVNAGGADPFSLASALRIGSRGRTFALRNDALRLPIRRIDRSGQLTQGPAR